MDGGINHPLNPDNYTAESDEIILYSPEKEGVAFNGWYDSETDGDLVTAIPLGSTGN